MAPEKHALLSASSASRWLVCTAAPRFEEGLPERTSEYAEEGRLAHAIAELKVLKKSTVMTNRTYNSRLNKLKKDPSYNPEMDKTTDLYLEYINELVMGYDSTPTVAVEVQVDFSAYVPEGFGTCDCCIIGGDTLSIVDYKHGKGVPVAAKGNPQMRLYALGALNRYAPIFGKPKTLSQIEELMGKKEFKEKIGSFVVKPLGKPTLAEASDKREAYNPAAADFAGAVPE